MQNSRNPLSFSLLTEMGQEMPKTLSNTKKFPLQPCFEGGNECICDMTSLYQGLKLLAALNIPAVPISSRNISPGNEKSDALP